MPTLTAPYKLAIIGEAPGRDEEIQGVPFVGMSGRFLMALLSRAGLSRDCCFIGNVCQTRPPDNRIEHFSWDGPEIQDGILSLRADLLDFKPNLCLLLGRTALKAAKDLTPHPLLGRGWTHSIDDWRGSLFHPTDINSPMFGFKCLASYHPAAVLRQYAWAPLLQFDIKKAAQEAKSPDLKLPVRDIAINLSATEACARLLDLLDRKPAVGTDIEGYWNGMTAIAFAESRTKAFVIQFQSKSGGSVYSAEAEAEIWRLLARVLEDPGIHKIWQNGLYDRFVLQYGHSIRVRGNADDIMLKHWELYCELEKSLGLQCSLYTDQPYYKGDRKSNDDTTYQLYNGTDSCVTTEINTFLTPKLQPVQREHYRFNNTLLNPMLYMEMRGIRYDSEKAKARREALLAAKYFEQFKLDALSGAGVANVPSVLAAVAAECCFKKFAYATWDDLRGNFKKDWVDVGERIIELGKKENPTPTDKGELATLADLHMNVNSKTQFQNYVYSRLALPIQYKKDPKTKVESPSTDYESLLNLVKKTGHDAPKLAITLRALSTRAGMLSIHADSDGRIRCGYNVVGSETGRLSCYTSPTGSGYNLQTIPNYTSTSEAPGGVLGDRDLFLADEGHSFFQCDLAGADGWTVAAHLRTLGHPRMFDDYIYGLKPAKILVLMLRHGESVNTKTREELATMCKEVEKDSWEYFACKQGQHGTCYLMGAIKLANRIFITSEGKVHLSSRETGLIQQMFEKRYRVSAWHEWMKRQLSASPTLTAASGHKRIFFGRSDEILGEALAHEPQANTTFATNKAALRLWQDPENRLPDGRLRIEPLHQVHDALCGQFRVEDTEFAKRKIPEWFNNPMTIAGQTITIPYEGGFGRSWGELDGGKI
jgi:uracil-DNA glycosylase family 4